MADLIYELSFRGAASPTLRAAFAEFELEAEGGTTRVWCPRNRLQVATRLIEDLGLELLQVRLLARSGDPAAHPGAVR